MSTLIVGASGATGQNLVNQLLSAGQKVKIIVRSTSKYPDHWKINQLLTIIEDEISELTVEKLTEYMDDCDAVACCLGHNVTWKGLFGKPRRLVADAVRLLYETINRKESGSRVKFVLMSTVGYRNKGLKEPISFGERIAIGLIRLLLPPHSDNEKAADFLRLKIGVNHPKIEWVALRPDTLINEDTVSEYTLHESPVTSPIFKPGKTSRINVGHFISKLLLDHELWETWKGRSPVIYNEMGGGK